jgi:hypothetical protein
VSKKNPPLSSRMGSRFGGGGRSRKKKQIGAGLATLLAVTYFGSTFAANVSLNDGEDLEFGQGTQAAVACDSDGITTAINEIWNNGEIQFDVATVVLSDVDASACADKVFRVTLLGDSGTELQLGNSSGQTFADIVVSNSNGALAVTSASANSGLTANISEAGTAGIITLILDRVGDQGTSANFLDAADVFRINLESNDA